MWSWHVATVDPGFHLILAEHLQKVQPTHTFSSIPRFQTCPCSCHSPSPHIFLSLPPKPNRLRLSWKSEAESGADLRHLIRPLTGGFMCMEYFGEAHHNSCGMDSLCIRHESSTRAASQRGVCCSRAAVEPTLRADLSFPGGHVCTLSCLTSADPGRGPLLSSLTSGCVWDPAAVAEEEDCFTNAVKVLVLLHAESNSQSWLEQTLCK